MNKKEFYEAPKWGQRMVTVERHYLNNGSLYNSDTQTEYLGGEEDGGDLS